MSRSNRIAWCFAVILPFTASAGPLSPPTGPIAPTHKTLTQIEPRTPVESLPAGVDSLHVISQPGSYYLTANLQGVSGKHGIRISSDNVVLDLNGFALLGVPGSIDGLTDEGSATYSNISIHSGAARDWGRDGVNAAHCVGGRLEGLSASNNGRHGLAAGNARAVSACTARGNGSHGITGYMHNSFAQCSAYENLGHGFAAGSGSILEGCTGAFNTGSGFALFFATSPGADSLITGCTSRRNGEHGIVADAVFGPADPAVSISNCVVSGNSLDGIRVRSNSTVRDNTVHSNAASGAPFAGIQATGSGNRIDANNVCDIPIGIRTQSGGNVIVRNTLRGHTTAMSVVTTTDVGPMQQASTATSPWANITY